MYKIYAEWQIPKLEEWGKNDFTQWKKTAKILLLEYGNEQYWNTGILNC